MLNAAANWRRKIKKMDTVTGVIEKSGVKSSLRKGNND